MLENISVIIYSISSSHRLLEYARVIHGFGIKNIVITRATGSAAQLGIPELFKLALRHNLSVIVLNDLNEVKEYLKIDKLYFLSNRCRSGIELLLNDVKLNFKIGLVVHGLDLSFTPKELELGEELCVINRDLSSIALLVITLYELLKRLSSQ